MASDRAGHALTICTYGLKMRGRREGGAACGKGRSWVESPDRGSRARMGVQARRDHLARGVGATRACSAPTRPLQPAGRHLPLRPDGGGRRLHGWSGRRIVPTTRHGQRDDSRGSWSPMTATSARGGEIGPCRSADQGRGVRLNGVTVSRRRPSSRRGPGANGQRRAGRRPCSQRRVDRHDPAVPRRPRRLRRAPRRRSRSRSLGGRRVVPIARGAA